MLDGISTKIFADGADLDGILRLAEDPLVDGFTTNSTLMWNAGLKIRHQAEQMAAWGPNVYVTIPAATTGGVSLTPLVQANDIGCHIIALPHNLLPKVKCLGDDDLDQLSLETVQMSHRNAAAAGFTL